jgi:hypothetical protein
LSQNTLSLGFDLGAKLRHRANELPGWGSDQGSPCCALEA